MLELPHCDELEDFRLELDPEEEQRLIEELAEKGERAIDDLIFRERQKAVLKEKISKLRKILERQSSRLHMKQKKHYQELLDEMEERYNKLQKGAREHLEEDLSGFDQEREKTKERYQDMKMQSLSDLEKALEADGFLKLMVEEPSREKPGFWSGLWKRFGGGLKRTLMVIMSFFRWLLSLFGFTKSEAKKPREDRILIFSNRAVSNVYSDLDGKVGKSLVRNMKFREAVDREMEESGRRTLRTRMDEDWYKQQAKEIIEEKLKEMVADQENDVEKQQDELEQDLEQIRREEERRRKEYEKEKKDIEWEKERQDDKLERDLDHYPEHLLKQSIIDDLEKLGYIKHDGVQMTVTPVLIERFANIILTQELQAIPSVHLSHWGSSEKVGGSFQKEKMRSIDEVSRMDIVESVINSRINHPWEKHIEDEDIIINRERSEYSTHAVIALDTSFSMLENNRMLAARKAVLALYKAIKKNNPKNVIDIIGFDTHVEVMDLVSVWQVKPRGFTNTHGALRTARLLFRDSKYDNKIFYLVTDGLPEAYVDGKGNDVVSYPEKCLPYAVREARKLDARLIMILLEPKARDYISAAEAIVKAAPKSRMLVTDPQKLARDLLEDFILS